MKTRFIGVCALLVFILSISLVLTGTAHASDIRQGDTVVIEDDEVIDDDLVVTAGTIQMDGTVNGDLVAGGANIIVNGVVKGSAILAGQTIVVNGQVEGSLYAGAYGLTLGEGAVVGRNLYFAGYSLNMHPDSLVQRDVLASGYQLVHDGVIGRDLNVSLSALELNGEVRGDVTGQIATGQNGLPPRVLIPNMPANIEAIEPGFRSDSTAEVGGEILLSEIITAEEPKPDTGVLGLPAWLTERLGEFIGLLIVAAVMVYLLPQALPDLSGVIQRRPLASLGWGALIHLLLFPLGLITGLFLVVLLTIIFGVITFGEFTGAILGLTGSLYAFLLFAFLFYAYVIAWLVVGHLIGHSLLANRLNITGRWPQFLAVALGVLLFELLRAIPIAGTLVALVVSFLALGALAVYWVDRRRPSKITSEAPGLGG